ncbi:MAG: hypothetical protein WD377_02245 [Nitriliruptoraceae bacterium]
MNAAHARTIRAWLATIVVGAVLAACGPNPSSDVETRVTALAEAQDELRQRVDALDSSAGLDSAIARINALEARIDDAVERLENIDADLDAADQARDELTSELAALSETLGAELADVRDTFVGLDARIADLDVRYEVLQTRIDRLQR